MSDVHFLFKKIHPSLEIISLSLLIFTENSSHRLNIFKKYNKSVKNKFHENDTVRCDKYQVIQSNP